MTIARHQFSVLQHKTFPIYFVLSIILSSSLLATWILKHPDVLVYLARPNVGDVAQVYALGAVLFSQGLNYFVIGPLTSQCVLRTRPLPMTRVVDT